MWNFCYLIKDGIKRIPNHSLLIQNRGPDYMKTSMYENVLFMFYRLAINGLNVKANQPFEKDGIHVICNGEIYNHKLLKMKENISEECISGSDCEVLIPLYKRHGFKKLCQMIDGVFAIILYDSNKKELWVGRDPYGVRPLFSDTIKN